MSGGPPRRVFVSHSSADKPAVKQLVDALRARGIDAWYDEYEISPGDDIVARMNEGLASRDVGLVVFSASTDQGPWVRAEISTLFYERVKEGKLLIPVILGDGVRLPPLIKPLARVNIEDVDHIADAIHHRRIKPPVSRAPVVASHTVVLTLKRDEIDAIRVTVTLDGAELASCTHAALPRELIDLRDDFLSGFRHATLRSPVAIERRAKEASIAALGRAMAAFCLPGAAASPISALLDGDGQIPGASIEFSIEGEDPVLVSLPYESLRLPGSDRLVVDHPAVTMVRRPAQLVWPLADPLPGPLKILVAVGAPDEGKTASNVLDHERELQNILDAVEPAQRIENVEVRILEASDPDTIRDALTRDQYHVLYITCHGKPGALELDDEEGDAVDATAADLLDALRRAQRPMPLIFVNSCHGAVDKQQTASLGEALLRGGVPAVLAMQTSVSDAYGTALAHAFFDHLSRNEGALASRALAHARRGLEGKRREALARRDEGGLTLPEYATPTLFVAGIESPLVDFGRDKQPLQARPIHELAGQVPQLRQDDLIGRRRELRRALWVLRPPRNTEDTERTLDGLRKGPAFALIGIGGVGKSTIAGRAMRRLAEDGFLIASHVGTWDLGAIASAVGDAVLDGANPAMERRGKELTDPALDDARRLRLLAKTLSEAPVLLVLDDFEQNLTRDGAAFLDHDLPRYLAGLVSAARRGRLLITSRFPVPGLAGLIATSSVGPLTDADVRKLVLRLPGLRSADTATLRTALRTIGNHPRVLELLDALARGGVGRLPHVTAKLNDLVARSGTVVPGAASGDLPDALRQAFVLGARDVFLDELLAMAQQRGLAEILFQTAVSNLPVHAAGVAHMLADAPAPPEAVEQVAQALRQLEAMSLVVPMPEGGAWVHRWTAEGLAQPQPQDEQRVRWARAGRYRSWRAEHESHDLHDHIEAVRNFLRAEAWDDAVTAADIVIGWLGGHHQTIGVVSLIAEVLAALPEDHRAKPWLLVTAGDAYKAVGQIEEARKAYAADLAIVERLVATEPERADYQRDLSISYSRMGDLYWALGQGDNARKAYAADLAIAERLAAAEPERANYQHGLSVSHERMGDRYWSLGQGDDARKAYAASLAIRERLAAADPKRGNYQRDLSVSYNRMGDLYWALGQGDEARKAYAAALSISERLAAAEPERADYQRDLSVSHERIGDLFRALGQGDEARKAYATALAIREQLAEQEPERADYQRELLVPYHRMGDLFLELAQGDWARKAYTAALAISERLAAQEPEHTDYQHVLSISHHKMGDLFRALGQGDDAQKAYAHALAISEQLATAEPERTDYQRVLSVSYTRLASLAEHDGRIEEARTWYERDLAITEKLAAAEPGRADYQVDVAVSLVTTARHAGSDTRALLERAASILRTLDAEGRLAPADRAKLDALARMLATLP